MTHRINRSPSRRGSTRFPLVVLLVVVGGLLLAVWSVFFPPGPTSGDGLVSGLLHGGGLPGNLVRQIQGGDHCLYAAGNVGAAYDVGFVLGGMGFGLMTTFLGITLGRIRRGKFELIFSVLALLLIGMVINGMLNYGWFSPDCSAEAVHGAGFGGGLWDSILMLLRLPLSWFNDTVEIYRPGGGVAYDVGYSSIFLLIAVINFFRGILRR